MQKYEKLEKIGEGLKEIFSYFCELECSLINAITF